MRLAAAAVASAGDARLARENGTHAVHELANGVVFGVGNIHGLVLIDGHAEGTVKVAREGRDREEADEGGDLRHLANEVVRGVGDVQISAERCSDP